MISIIKTYTLELNWVNVKLRLSGRLRERWETRCKAWREGFYIYYSKYTSHRGEFHWVSQGYSGGLNRTEVFCNTQYHKNKKYAFKILGWWPALNFFCQASSAFCIFNAKLRWLGLPLRLDESTKHRAPFAWDKKEEKKDQAPQWHKGWKDSGISSHLTLDASHWNVTSLEHPMSFLLRVPERSALFCFVAFSVNFSIYGKRTLQTFLSFWWDFPPFFALTSAIWKKSPQEKSEGKTKDRHFQSLSNKIEYSK